MDKLRLAQPSFQLPIRHGVPDVGKIRQLRANSGNAKGCFEHLFSSVSFGRELDFRQVRFHRSYLDFDGSVNDPTWKVFGAARLWPFASPVLRSTVRYRVLPPFPRYLAR